jgi:20S proteasome alpha/beta subunit
MIQRATQRGGGRPYGVQALLLGVDGDEKWQLYSCDPTGLYRHFPKGRAAIGKYANPIAVELNEEDKSSCAKEALELCLASLVQTATKENVKLDLDSFEGLFLWTSEAGECQVAQIDPTFLDECYEAAQTKATLKESKASS